jgi:hypothetical protein
MYFIVSSMTYRLAASRFALSNPRRTGTAAMDIGQAIVGAAAAADGPGPEAAGGVA